MKTKRYCFALDLKEDAQLIAAYDQWHQKGNTWPAITQSIKEAGITSLEIYRTGNRLFMIMEAPEHFDLQHKAAMDAANEKVQEWETLMWQYQQALPWAKPGDKWVLMEQLFQL